jgi:hypothetical protein
MPRVPPVTIATGRGELVDKLSVVDMNSKQIVRIEDNMLVMRTLE